MSGFYCFTLLGRSWVLRFLGSAAGFRDLGPVIRRLGFQVQAF